MPSSTVFCLSWAYQTAAVEQRADIARAIAQVCDKRRVQIGYVSLITCNRAELYINEERFPVSPNALLTEIADITGIPLQTLQENGRIFRGEEAQKHLMRVAAGLESMVLGESQILGQVTDAWETAISQKTICPQLNAIFRAAVRAGKRARNETAISRHPVSMSSVAIQALLASVDKPQAARGLVVGYGEMGRLGLKSLRGRGVRTIGIVNRRPERARAEALEHGHRLWGLDQLEEALVWADVALTAAASPEPLIDRGLLERVMKRRQGRPLAAVDIAVPQNIAANAADIDGFHLIGIDQLKQQVDQGLAARQRCAPAVEAIIDEEMAKLTVELRELAIRPLIRELREKAEAIRHYELERTMRYLGEVDEPTRRQLQYFSQALMNKLLHEPTVRLRQKAALGEIEPYEQTVRELFGLS
ncbi:MAG: glutamyl-tRNA reductase [Chloroflexi bacterium]|nr:glutamyl-tRNA reductase [Chloroflexota bacterium]